MGEPERLSPQFQAVLDRLKAEDDKREGAEIIQLPLWAEQKRGTPNSFLRSSLFAAVQGKDRRFMKEEVLASQNGIVVKFTGEQLNQSDLDVWETLVHLARQHPLGDLCSFTAHGLLKALGLHTGNKDHKWLHSLIIRLTACAVQITHGGTSLKSSPEDGGMSAIPGLRIWPYSKHFVAEHMIWGKEGQCWYQSQINSVQSVRGPTSK